MFFLRRNGHDSSNMKKSFFLYLVLVLIIGATTLLYYVNKYQYQEILQPDESWVTPKLRKSLTPFQIYLLKGFDPKCRDIGIKRALDRSWVTDDVKLLFAPNEIDQISVMSAEDRSSILSVLKRKSLKPRQFKKTESTEPPKKADEVAGAPIQER